MNVQYRTEHEVSRALRLDRAARGVEALRCAALAAEKEFAAELDAVAPSMRESAYNLVHYSACAGSTRASCRTSLRGSA